MGVTAPSLSIGNATDHPVTPLTNSNVFHTAVALWFSNNASAIQTYGHIMNWDVSSVTSMFEAFKNRTAFNEDVRGWDVSNVTNMARMFQGATAFDQDIGGWDVSSVTNMNHIFRGTSSAPTVFNQDLSGWSPASGATNNFWDADSNPAWIAAHKPTFT